MTPRQIITKRTLELHKQNPTLPWAECRYEAIIEYLDGLAKKPNTFEEGEHPYER